MGENYGRWDAQDGKTREDAMINAKRILKDIILKMATESLVTFKQNFLRLPLNEQKRILNEHGLKKQGVFSRGLHSLQKRLGYRSNNNSRKGPNFLEAQERYFKAIIEEKYNIIVSRLGHTEPDKSIKAILYFFDMYHSSIIDNPKRKIYEWLKRLPFKDGYPGIDIVIPWAINKYFAGAADAGAVLAELAAARAQGRMPILPAHREMAHPPNPPPAPMDYPRAAAAEEEEEDEEDEEDEEYEAEVRREVEAEAKFKADMAKLKGLDPVRARNAAWKLQKAAADAAAARRAAAAAERARRWRERAHAVAAAAAARDASAASASAAAAEGPAASDLGPDPVALRAAEPAASRGPRAGFDDGVGTWGPRADAEASAARAAEMALRNPPPAPPPPPAHPPGPPRQALWGPSPDGGGSRRKSQRRKRGRKARRTRRH